MSWMICFCVFRLFLFIKCPEDLQYLYTKFADVSPKHLGKQSHRSYLEIYILVSRLWRAKSATLLVKLQTPLETLDID